MNISITHDEITTIDSPALVVSVVAGTTIPSGIVDTLNTALDGAISSLITDGEIKGKRGEITLLHTFGRIAANRVVLVGLGKIDTINTNVIRGLAGSVARFLRARGISDYASVIYGSENSDLTETEIAQSIVEGTEMGLYTFDKHKSKKADNKIQTFTLVSLDKTNLSGIQSAITRGHVVADAVAVCRNMANEPPNFMTPAAMAETALEAAISTGMEIEVLERPEMTKLGMGALLGVAQGSEEPPKLIVLRYHGDPNNEENNLGLIGKGITFDSGGLDIKPASGMAEMKSDMAGGAAVIGAMKAIAQLKPKVNVTGIVPATENMPSGSAQRPSDVVTAMNGKTIEIGNTDAEGRLVLADGVSYARSMGITNIVDVATLTGAVIVALGNQASGIFGNDQSWVDEIIEAGEGVGERLWQLPTYSEYKDEYKSDIADISNTGGRGAGATIGALIIGEFADGSRWAHLDIAGTNRTKQSDGYNPKGATGNPVRTLIALAEAQGK